MGRIKKHSIRPLMAALVVVVAVAAGATSAPPAVHIDATPVASAASLVLQNAFGQCNGPSRIQANSPAMWLTAIESEGVLTDAAHYAQQVGYSPRDSGFPMWVNNRTMIVRLPYPVQVMDYYCPSGQHRMLPWRHKWLPTSWPVLVVLPPTLSHGNFSLTPRAGYTARSVTFQILAQPSCGNVSTGKVTITVYVLGKSTTPPATCTKKNAANYGGPLPCTYTTPARWTVFVAKIAWKWDSASGQWVKVSGVPVTIRRFVGKKPVQAWRVYSGGKWYRLTGSGKRPTKLCEVTKKADLYQPRYGACVAVKWSPKDKAWEAIFVNQTKKGPPPGTSPPPNSPPSSPPGSGTVPKTPPDNPGGGGPGNPGQGNPQPPGAGDTPPGGSSAPPPGPPSACQDPNSTDACQPPPP